MKKKILIIDDFVPLLDEVSEFLSIEGYKVFTAKDGAEGVQKTLQYQPNLILCDIEMPIMNGYDLLRTLEKIPDTANIPIIFLTAKATTEDFRYGLSLGAEDYLTKPFTIDELKNTIKKRLEKHEHIIKSAESKFFGLAENPIIGVYIYMADKFIFVNNKLCEITNYTTEEYNTLDIFDLLVNDKEKTKAEFLNCYKGINPNLISEIPIKTKQNEVKLLKFFGKYTQINGKNAIIGGVIEIESNIQKNAELGSCEKIKTILQYLTENDKIIVEGALASGNNNFNTEQKEKNLIAKIGLSKREIEVLQYICMGYTNTEIGDKLFLSKRTVDRHRANIMEKTNSPNTAKLVGFSIKHKLVEY